MSVLLNSGKPTPGADVMTGDQWATAERQIIDLCESFSITRGYCDRVDVELGRVTFHLYKGKEGRCKGPKYVVGGDHDPRDPLPEPLPDGWGEAARETVVFEVPPPPARVLVVGETQAMARKWCKANDIPPYGQTTRILGPDGSRGVFLRDADRLVFVGDVESRSDYDRIKAALLPSLWNVGGLDKAERFPAPA